MKAALSALVAALLFSSCANHQRLKAYDDVKRQKHETSDVAILYYDRPDLNRMLVMPSAGRGIGNALLSEVTLGIYAPGNDPYRYQAAAQDYLKRRGKGPIYDGKMLAPQTWEFLYQPQP